MNDSDLVYERVLDKNLSFSLHGLRHRLPEDDYWARYVGKKIHIDDEYKRGMLLIQPRGVGNLSNLYVVAYVRDGYAWLRNDFERVDLAERKFIADYCARKGWNPSSLTIDQWIEVTDQPGYRRAGEIRKRARGKK